MREREREGAWRSAFTLHTRTQEFDSSSLSLEPSKPQPLVWNGKIENALVLSTGKKKDLAFKSPKKEVVVVVFRLSTS